MLQQLNVADRRVLDVGCGTGRWAELVVNRLPHAEVWGLDLSEKMLEHAAVRAGQYPGRMHFTHGNSQELPYEDASFDLVTCSHSFHHYPDQLQVVKEMRRVLKPSGRVMLVDGCRDTFWGWFIFDGIVTWAEGHVHHCSKGLMQTLFREAGFEHATQIMHRYPVPYLLTMGTVPAAKSRSLRKVA
jgi:ubiquinone/menaquinone biosynthesis C-methylase UbiE